MQFEDLAREFLLALRESAERLNRSISGLRRDVRPSRPAEQSLSREFRERFFALDLGGALRALPRTGGGSLDEVMRARVYSLQGKHEIALALLFETTRRIREERPAYSALGLLSYVGCFASDSAKLCSDVIHAPLAASDAQLQSRTLAPFRAYAERARCSAAESIGDLRAADSSLRRLASLKKPCWSTMASVLAARAGYAFSFGKRKRSAELASGAALAALGCDPYGMAWASHRLASYHAIVGDSARADLWRDTLAKSGCHSSGIRAFMRRTDEVTELFRRSGLMVCS